MLFQKENGRIYAEDSNGMLIAEITFPLINDNTVDLNHTFVHPSLRGQGVADTLVRMVVNDLKDKKLKATVSCSYAIKWFESHPEWNEILIQK